MEGAWSCYRGGTFNGLIMVMLQKRSLYWKVNGHTEVVFWRENGHVTVVVSLMEREWSCYGGGQFNGGRMIMLEGWSVLWRENGHSTEVASLMEENGHVTEVASLMEGELSCYRGGHCKGRRIVMLQFNGGKMMLQRWPV